MTIEELQAELLKANECIKERDLSISHFESEKQQLEKQINDSNDQITSLNSDIEKLRSFNMELFLKVPTATETAPPPQTPQDPQESIDDIIKQLK